MLKRVDDVVRFRFMEVDGSLPSFLTQPSEDESTGETPEPSVDDTKTVEQSSEAVSGDIWERLEHLEGDPDDQLKKDTLAYMNKLSTQDKLDSPVDEVFTPLTFSILYDVPFLFEHLILIGVDINQMDGSQEIPLIVTASVGDVDKGKVLIEKGAKLDVVDDKGDNILLVSLKEQHFKYVDMVCSEVPKIVLAVYNSYRAYKKAMEFSNWTVKFTKHGQDREMNVQKYMKKVMDDIDKEHDKDLADLFGKSFTQEEMLDIIQTWYPGNGLNAFKTSLKDQNLQMNKTSPNKAGEVWHIDKIVRPSQKTIIPKVDEDEEPVEISVSVPVPPEPVEGTKEPKKMKKAQPKSSMLDDLTGFLPIYGFVTLGNEKTKDDWEKIITRLLPELDVTEGLKLFRKAFRNLGFDLATIKNSDPLKWRVVKNKKKPAKTNIDILADLISFLPVYDFLKVGVKKSASDWKKIVAQLLPETEEQRRLDLFRRGLRGLGFDLAKVKGLEPLVLKVIEYTK